jgi:hypothetical protein
VPDEKRVESEARPAAVRRALTIGRASLAALVALAAPIAASRAAFADVLRTTDAQGRVVDWTAGQLIARGLGVADRHAPSPATARPAARRRAIADAARQLASAAALVPSDARASAPTMDRKALEALAADAIVLSADPLVDGSWRVELALPLEALRQATSGARELPARGDAPASPAVVIVRAPAGTPLLGVAISDGKTTVRGATLWATKSTDGVPLPERALAQAPTLVAERSGATLRVAKLAGASDATLFVVVLGQ